MPAVPLPARFTACSTIDAIPWRSMSFMVNTWTCESRTDTFSRSSRFRTPMITVCAGETVGDGRNGTGGKTMVAAEHDRHRALFEGSERRLIQLLTDLRDVANVLLVLVAQFLRLRNRRRQIAFVDDAVAERRDALAQAGDAKRRRSHVDAAPAAAKVERHTDDVNRFHEPTDLTIYRTLRLTDIPSPDGVTMLVNRRGSRRIASRKSR